MLEKARMIQPINCVLRRQPIVLHYLRHKVLNGKLNELFLFR